QAANYDAKWPGDLERVWVGPDYWANRLQDWRLKDGRVECVESSVQRPMRTLQLLTAGLNSAPGELVMSVRTGAVQPGNRRSAETWTGFLIGAGGPNVDHRLTALVHHRSAEDGGILVAVDGTGKVIFRDNNGADPEASEMAVGPLQKGDLPVLAPATRTGNGFVADQSLDDVELRVEIKSAGEKFTLTATALLRSNGKVLSSGELRNVEPRDVDGSVALVSHLGPPGSGAGYWFRDWKLSGRKVVLYPERSYGPVLATQYTVQRNVLKLTAQFPPMGTKDINFARLEVRETPADPWRLAARATIVEPGYTLPFRVEKWDTTKDHQYRVVYDLRSDDGQAKAVIWEGVVRKAPTDRENVVVAAFTGNKNFTGGLRWNPRGAWFPHQDVVKAVAAQQPDLLFFSGDQVYEGDLTGAQRAPADKAQLDYLDKWYRWCWAFGDLARNTPCICIPDDHDVYHGNLWGAGGRAAKTQDEGGYTMPAEFVNMVQRTQTSHLPDAVDPTRVDQGIEVYFTRLELAGISFAVLEDRKFKSSPTVMVPEGKCVNGWFQNPRFDPARQADVAGAELLGERQLRFIRDWAGDWSEGTWVKVALSQTLFANVATLPKDATNDSVVQRLKRLKPDEYPVDDRLVADADSNSWPQTGRNTALRELRRGFALHIAGDQHLGSLVRYGVDQFDDAGYAFCVPSIANTFPRRWYPPEGGANRKPDAPKYTGQFRDGFGNLMTVHAVSNPVVSGHEPAALHDRAPGYGIIKFNRKSREATFECWPRWADSSKPDSRQYPGWPVTVNVMENYGREAAAHLPTIRVTGLADPVVQVIDEGSSETLYTLRIAGDQYQPKAFREGKYTVKIGEPGTAKMRTLTGLEARKDNQETVVVDFGS
ncbi:MAG TPA: alkaline phosphatase D family protein, partial [Pirellulaceae bacterium]|nr:alkaline phosphatase D family protein [Pirellulaceae bacterium]